MTIDQAKSITVTLSEPIQRRMLALFQQRQAVEENLRATLATAIEAMGYEGRLHLDADTWEVTITPLPEEPPAEEI